MKSNDPPKDSRVDVTYHTSPEILNEKRGRRLPIVSHSIGQRMNSEGKNALIEVQNTTSTIPIKYLYS